MFRGNKIINKIIICSNVFFMNSRIYYLQLKISEFEEMKMTGDMGKLM